MQTMNNGCRWILQPAKPGEAACYCGKPTQRRNVIDDDGNRTSQWETFCVTHTLINERDMKEQAKE